MKLQDKFRDSRVCKMCGSPVERIGTMVASFDTGEVLFAFQDRPIRFRKCESGDPGAQTFTRPGRPRIVGGMEVGGAPITETWVVFELMCSGESPEGHIREHSGKPLYHVQTLFAELPEWCYRDAVPGDRPDMSDFLPSKPEVPATLPL
jgi:hypothetical protein